MIKQRFLTLSLLLACSLSMPAIAADGPEPMTYGQSTTQQTTQAESDRNTMHMTDAGDDTGLQASNSSASNNLASDTHDANDPDDPQKSASGGNFWLMMPLLLLGGIGLFFIFRRPVGKTV